LGLRSRKDRHDSLRAARLWTTVTPIVLDRYPKKQNPDDRAKEVAECIARACQNIGLPEPSYVAISATSEIPNAPVAHVRRDAPAWESWQLPHGITGRYLSHATIGFNEPVQGPVILGAGRYVGLGLCLPIDGWAKQ